MAYIDHQRNEWSRNDPLNAWHGYTTNELRDVYFNAHLFHSDVAKRSVLTEVLEKMNSPSLNAILFLDIQQKMRVLKNIALTIEPIVAGHSSVLVPKRFSS